MNMNTNSAPVLFPGITREDTTAEGFARLAARLEKAPAGSREKRIQKLENLLEGLRARVERPRTGWLSEDDFALLLTPEGAGFLEEMAWLAREVTRVRFGKTIQLYAPLYLSNECKSRCTYCSFSFENKIARLTLDEKALRHEAAALAGTGIQHVLLLTGEDTRATPVDYIARSVEICRDYFTNISLEIYPLSVADYSRLVAAGAEGLTLYQETYDRGSYARVHLGGKKKNYDWRLEGIYRAGEAGFRKLGVGALLGLSRFRPEVFLLGRHARFLMKKFWRSEVQVSLPRIRPAIKSFRGEVHVTDSQFAQMYFALRLYLPDAGLVLSTRESPHFRDSIAGLGINSMSTGSKTEPGGYTGSGALTQFEIEDNRTPRNFARALESAGLTPVWKNWDSTLTGNGGR